MWFHLRNMNRRSFLRTTSAASLLAGSTQTLSALAADNIYRKNIGLQIYTVRDQMAADTPGTIKAIAEAGFHQIELQSLDGCEKVMKLAKDHGLAVNSCHFDWNTVVHPSDDGLSSFQALLEKAVKVKLSHLVMPYFDARDRKSLDDYKRLAANLNKAAVLTKKAGLQLAYHNHSFEYEPMNGSNGFEVFEKEFAPEMKFELDVFWAKAAGRDPLATIKKLSGRISQLHLKDLKEGLALPIYNDIPHEAFKELGKGIIPMEPIIEAAKAAGVAHCHVEQDQSPDPLASIKMSIAHLRGL